jgi:hypothetical protein
MDKGVFRDWWIKAMNGWLDGRFSSLRQSVGCSNVIINGHAPKGTTKHESAGWAQF